MKEKVVIDVISGVERSKWQPRKRRSETVVPDRFPKRTAPFDVIVTVKIATADCGRRKLEFPKDKDYNDRPDRQLESSYEMSGSKRGEFVGVLHQPFNCTSGSR